MFTILFHYLSFMRLGNFENYEGKTKENYLFVLILKLKLLKLLKTLKFCLYTSILFEILYVVLLKKLIKYLLHT